MSLEVPEQVVPFQYYSEEVSVPKYSADTEAMFARSQMMLKDQVEKMRVLSHQRIFDTMFASDLVIRKPIKRSKIQLVTLRVRNHGRKMIERMTLAMDILRHGHECDY